MGGNPKDSPWRSTPDEDRKRPRFGGTVPRDLLDEVREKAQRVGITGRGADSAILEEALRAWVGSAAKPGSEAQCHVSEAAAPDLRAIVAARMVELGLDQAGAARMVAPAWGCQPESAQSLLSRWAYRSRDLSTDHLAALLDVLGLTVAPTSDAER